MPHRKRTIGVILASAALIVGVATPLWVVNATRASTPSAQPAPPSVVPASTASTLYASPSGAAKADCSRTTPCALATAVASAPAGATVLLAGGTYPTVTIGSGKGTPSSPVTVTAAAGQSPVLSRLTTSAPSVIWTGLTVSTTFLLQAGAAGSQLTDMTFDGGGLFVRASDSTVSSSTFSGGSSIDGIQVSAATGVLITGNRISDYRQDRDNGLHADCIQVFDAADVTIRGNSLRNCYNAGIILSVGQGKGIDGILIESNFIQGCLVTSAACNGGTAVDLREPTASGVVLRNNTILDGPTRLAALPASSYDRNIIGYLADCAAPVTNSLIAEWNRNMCAQPTALASRGNVQRVVPVVDAAAGDLHVTSGTAAMITPWGSLTPASRDIDGRTMDRRIVGAHSPSGLGVDNGATSGESVIDTSAPTVAIVAPASGTVVAGALTLKAQATDDQGVASVSFFAGSTHVGAAKKSTSGEWTLSLTASGIPADSYSLTARAVDINGNAATSSAITLVVK